MYRDKSRGQSYVNGIVRRFHMSPKIVKPRKANGVISTPLEGTLEWFVSGVSP